MAKRRYRRYYKKKGRWSANIRSIVNNSFQLNYGDFFATLQLAQNPVQSDTTVSQQYTVKNIEFTFQIESGSNNPTIRNGLESIAVFIMYVPQGMTVDNSYVNNHPEYIMAYRFIGSPDFENPLSDENYSNVYRNPIYVKSRMARRLQTGDSIICLIKGFAGESSNIPIININGIVRWWTKAN